MTFPMYEENSTRADTPQRFPIRKSLRAPDGGMLGRRDVSEMLSKIIK